MDDNIVVESFQTEMSKLQYTPDIWTNKCSSESNLITDWASEPFQRFPAFNSPALVKIRL